MVNDIDKKLQIESIQKQIEFIKLNLRKAYWASEDAHDILFKNSSDDLNQLKAGLFLNKAISIISSCKSLYYSNLIELERNELDEIFIKFDSFENEFLDNIKTQHSHQWTDIKFLEFQSYLNSFINLNLK